MLLLIKALIGATFLSATIAKIIGWSSFIDSLIQLELPVASRYPQVSAFCVVFFEVLAAIMLVAGGRSAQLGFVLSLLMMMGFTATLASVLMRQMNRQCNCFGATSQRPIDALDIVRNVGLGICCVIGIILSQTTQIVTTSWIEMGLLGVMGIFIALVWANLGEIYHLVKS